MPLFIYRGQGSGITISGTSVHTGIPIELTGNAAAAAAEHPDFELVEGSESSGSGAPSALAGYAALKARAKELGIPAKGKADELAAAIAAAEAAAAPDPDFGAD